MTAVVDGELLRTACDEGWAIVGFSIYNLEQGIGVVRAAEAVGVPVLLQAGSSAFHYAGRDALASLALGLARSATVPVGVHLDHATELGDIEACLQLGYTSVMFDGSALPIAENIRRTRHVVERAHRAGAWVEAELAGLAGDEDESDGAGPGPTTDPAAAARFVAETGVDALAVAIGNVHGIGTAAVALDLGLLRRIADEVPVPLVMHGASGLPHATVTAAIAAGIAKLNVNTELRRALRATLITIGRAPPAGDGIRGLLGPAIDATQAVAERKLRAFSVARKQN